MNATLWLMEKSAWVVVAVGIVVTGLGLWLKMHYGNLTGQPDRLWTHVTWPKALTMLSVAAMSFAVGIYAVGRNRRGEPPLSVGIVAWFEKLLDGSAAPSASFRTPQQAQYWAEWRQKGWIMPGEAIFGVVFGLLIWLLASRHAKDLLEGVAAGGMMLPAVGIIAGLLIGNVGHNDSSFEMAQFRATRPLTSTELAWSLLKVSAKSVLAGWIVWVATLVVTVVALYLIGANVNPFNPAAALIFVPAALVGGWIFVTTVASAALTGRRQAVHHRDVRPDGHFRLAVVLYNAILAVSCSAAGCRCNVGVSGRRHAALRTGHIHRRAPPWHCLVIDRLCGSVRFRRALRLGGCIPCILAPPSFGPSSSAPRRPRRTCRRPSRRRPSGHRLESNAVDNCGEPGIRLQRPFSPQLLTHRGLEDFRPTR